MKFANIDDAIMEAAKKPAAKPAPKAAAKKVEPKKAPAKPAPKPAAKKKTVAKITAPKKTGTKKRVVTPPSAPETDDKGTENKGAEEKPTQEKPAETKPTQSADSGKPRKFASGWLQSKPRGIGDRLKTAWKGFTAKAGDKIDVPHKYKSVFHEISKLMEQLRLVESMLQEQSLNESYDARTVNNLYAHRDAIRSVLVEQIVREELYEHNLTVTELDQRQRAALMKTVTVRANALWEGLEEGGVNLEDYAYDEYTLEEWIGALQEAGLDEGRLRNLAGALGLGAAALMGGAGDAGAQGTPTAQAPTAQVPNDSVQTGTSRDMQTAINKANFELDRKKISRQGARQNIVRNPDGIYTATVDVRQRPQTGAPQMEEQYTLEEWMGALEEAGVQLNELSPETLARYIPAAADDVAHRAFGAGLSLGSSSDGDDDAREIPIDRKVPKRNKGIQTALRKLTKKESYTLEEWMGALEEAGVQLNELSPETLYSAAEKRHAQYQTANDLANKNVGSSAIKLRGIANALDAKAGKLTHAYQDKRVKQAVNKDVASVGLSPTLTKKLTTEDLNENTVARLQSLAGINPTK